MFILKLSKEIFIVFLAWRHIKIVPDMGLIGIDM